MFTEKLKGGNESDEAGGAAGDGDDRKEWKSPSKENGEEIDRGASFRTKRGGDGDRAKEKRCAGHPAHSRHGN